MSAGASGAVFGLFGGLLGLLVTRRGALPPDFVQRHTTSILGFIGYNIFFGMTNPAINNAAHMGGLATGFLMALALSPDVTARRKWGLRQTAGTLFVVALLAGGTVVAKRKVEESRDAKLLSLVYSSSKFELKRGQEVFYASPVTKEEAQTLAQGLAQGGYFKEGQGASAMLSKDEHGYVVSYIPSQEVYKRPNADRIFEIQATDHSADIFGGKPLTLQMCDEYFVPQKSVRAGSRVKIGRNKHIYFRGGATPDEANALAATLRERRFLDGDGGAHIELEKKGDGYEAFFVVKDGTWDDPGAVAWYQTLASNLSATIFSERPVTIHLCDSQLTTRKTVSSER